MSKARGEVWAWGWQQHGQCARDPEECSEIQIIPRIVSSMCRKGVSDVVSGHVHTIFLTEDGSLWTCGSGSFGRLGHGNKDSLFLPRKIDSWFGNKIISVTAGGEHSACIDEMDLVYTWGCGYFGRLGHGAADSTGGVFNHSSRPKAVCKFDKHQMKVVKIDCGGNHTAALTDDGRLWVCGYNKEGQCAVGKSDLEAVVNLTEVLVPGGRTPIDVICGVSHTLVIASDGTVWSAGSNDHGQLGLGHTNMMFALTQINVLAGKVKKIVAGLAHTVALGHKGEVWTFGRRSDGTANNETKSSDTTKDVLIPKLATFPDGDEIIVDIAAGRYHCGLITEKGEVYMMGANKYAQCGLDPQIHGISIANPTKVPGFRGCKKLSLGAFNSIGLCFDRNLEFFNHIQSGSKDHVDDLIKLDKVNPGIKDEQGMTPLILAASLGHHHLIPLLTKNSKGENLINTGDALGRTALHHASANNFSEAVQVLLSLGADILAADHQKKHAIHHAVINHHLDLVNILAKKGADLDATDVSGKNPLQYCSFEEAFKIKIASGRFDVLLFAHQSDAVFAKKLSESIEKSYVKCHIEDNNTKSDMQALMNSAKGVVFILSKKSVNAANWMKVLHLSKEIDKTIFPIWKEKVTMTPELESLVYRTQLVDFSEPPKYNVSLRQLLSGLRNLETKGKQKTADKKTESKQASVKKSEKLEDKYIFTSFHAGDSDIEKYAKQILAKEVGIKCVSSDPNSTDVESEEILNCWVFVILLSSFSVSSRKVRDQLALAENHSKLIFPILAGKDMELDASMQYTFARAPKYDLTRHIPAAQREDNGILLASMIKMSLEVAKQATATNALSDEITSLKQKVKYTQDLVTKIRTAFGHKDKQEADHDGNEDQAEQTEEGKDEQTEQQQTTEDQTAEHQNQEVEEEVLELYQ